jgi:hypothetical protein
VILAANEIDLRAFPRRDMTEVETGSRRHTYLRPLGGAALAVRAMMGSEHEEPIVGSGFWEPEGLSACPRDGRTVRSIIPLVSVLAGRSVKTSFSLSASSGGLGVPRHLRQGPVIAGPASPDGPGHPDQLVGQALHWTLGVRWHFDAVHEPGGVHFIIAIDSLRSPLNSISLGCIGEHIAERSSVRRLK